MRILLNGEEYTIQPGSTLANLLTKLEIGSERVAVEVNLDIVPRAEYAVHALSEGDRVEIVHFVGGG